MKFLREYWAYVVFPLAAGFWLFATFSPTGGHEPPKPRVFTEEETCTQMERAFNSGFQTGMMAAALVLRTNEAAFYNRVMLYDCAHFIVTNENPKAASLFKQ